MMPRLELQLDEEQKKITTINNEADIVKKTVAGLKDKIDSDIVHFLELDGVEAEQKQVSVFSIIIVNDIYITD